jgi:hypothetical protein
MSKLLITFLKKMSYFESQRMMRNSENVKILVYTKKM